MKRLVTFFALALMTLSLASVSTTSRAASVEDGEGAQAVDPSAIVRAFTRKETEFRRALNGYTFKREAVVQTIGFGGQITGEYARTSLFTFNDAGERFERITYFPMPTLTEISFTNEDLEDLGGVQPFALEASKIDQYNFTFVGREKVDEIGTYVFDVAPKVVPKKVSERFFQGRVWVDDRDLQIVKVKGKGVPEGKQRFPTFETYREQIDGKFWFPTYTYADDDLTFEGGQVVHLRMKVRYTDYKRFRGKVRVIEEGEPGDVPDEPQTPPVKPKP
jgi:muconolactone delta-isomerase